MVIPGAATEDRRNLVPGKNCDMLPLRAKSGPRSTRPRSVPIRAESEMSRTLVVITAALAVLVTYLAVQPDRRERAKIMFSEISAWVQKQF